MYLILQRPWALLALACLTAFTAITAQAQAPVDPVTPADMKGKPRVQLPPGWMVSILPSVNGHFRSADSNDNALLMHREDEGLSALVVVTFTPDGGQASMVKTFKDDNANAPRLAVLAPGDYQPACHPGVQCDKVHVDNQAIRLQFDAASSDLIYFDGKQFRDMAITD